MKRVGIYGGSFDPVHLGHLQVAFAAREEMRLDRVIFVPTHLSPFKLEVQPAPASIRASLLRQALAGLEWCTVSEFEIQRGGVSYSVDTVQRLGVDYPGAALFLLLGEDNLSGLEKWYEIEKLKELVEFVVVPRPGKCSPTEIPGARSHRLKGWPMEVSSSEIRHRVKLNLPIGHLVPPVVAEAIRNNRLYLV